MNHQSLLAHVFDETSMTSISSMMHFLNSNRTATKIKYKFDIFTRMTCLGNTTDIVISKSYDY